MYWYIIECQLEDGRWFELSRYYADFYDLQIALIDAFPLEAGNQGAPRSLPFMPGPVAHVTDAISNGRRQNLDEYIKKILTMPPHISKSMLVRNLFRPKPGQDFEIDPNALNDDYRLSSGSQQSSLQQASRQPSNTQMHSGYGGMGPPPSAGSRGSHQRQQPSSGGYGGMMSPYGDRPHLQTQSSNLTQNSQNSGPAKEKIKMKLFFHGDGHLFHFDDNVSFDDVHRAMQKRVRTNRELALKYEDVPSGGQKVVLQSDQGLDVAIQRNIDKPNALLKVHGRFVGEPDPDEIT